MHMRKLLTAAALSGLAAFLPVGCGGDVPGGPMGPAGLPEVNTLVIEPYRVTYTTELVGRTSAFFVSEVRPQVSGIIQSRLFDEGAVVARGQQLYQIDPAMYQASLNSARAALQRAQASYEAARQLANRYAQVVKVNGVSRQQYDEAVAARNQADAEVRAAKAAVETAEINLEYTRVLSPIEGYIGQSSVTPGALVTANQAQPLATVQKLDSMYVDVSQSSVDILRLKKALAEGSIAPADGGGASVKLLLEDGSPYTWMKAPADGSAAAGDPIRGELQFSDVSVDPATGMVRVRAVFPNPDGLLFPGMYVRAMLEEGVIDRAILLPQQAVSRDPAGRPTALVAAANPKAGTVNEQTGRPEPDTIVELRILTVDKTIDGQYWLVTGGLSFGDQVIMEGSLKVRPGGGATARPMESPIKESETIRKVSGGGSAPVPRV